MALILETPRLTIREFVPEEQETYLDHFNDEELTLHIPKRSREERTGIFNTALANYSDKNKMQIWGMFDRLSGEFIGSCLLRPFNKDPGIIELGYSIERKHWNKGIGTEMATAVIKYGFSDPNTKAVVAVTTLGNPASQRVLEKAGLIRMDNLVKDGEELAYFKRSRT